MSDDESFGYVLGKLLIEDYLRKTEGRAMTDDITREAIEAAMQAGLDAGEQALDEEEGLTSEAFARVIIRAAAPILIAAGRELPAQAIEEYAETYKTARWPKIAAVVARGDSTDE